MAPSNRFKFKVFVPGVWTFVIATAFATFAAPTLLAAWMMASLDQRDKLALSESGYIDPDGRFAFHELNTVFWHSHFYEGRCMGPASNLQDKAGRQISLTKFISGDDFSEGLAGVRLEHERWGFIDLAGRLVIPAQFEAVQSFADGIAPAKLSGRWGFIDHSGKWLQKPIFENARPFSEGLATVCQNEKIGYIDTTGTLVIAPRYDAGAAFSEGVAQVVSFGTAEKKGEILYIDKCGQIVFVVDGDLSTTQNQLGIYAGKDTFYDRDFLGAGPDKNDFRTTGSRSHPDQESQTFKNGRQQFRKDRLLGYLDKNGKIAIPFKFTSAAPFSEGLAWFR